jgi:hypothetical protein
MKIGIAGVAIGLVLLFVAPGWLALAVILAAIAIPAIAYSMLSSSQRARFRRIRKGRRGQITR